MATPLYRKLKKSGTTIYAFPGAEEDINQVGDNYQLSFTKFVLLNLPEKDKWNFEKFHSLSVPTDGWDFGDNVVNGLRNYVANHETTIRNTKTNNTEYFYDVSVLQTSTERIFFKWMKKLNLIQFEPAISGDEYFGNLDDFEPMRNGDEYLREYLWKEREVSNNNIDKIEEDGDGIKVTYQGSVNYKVGDYVDFSGNELEVTGIEGDNKTVIFDLNGVDYSVIEDITYSRLVYNKLVRYIGEVQGSGNVVSNNISYDQTMAFIADNAGQTPDILFRTKTDNNYAPGLRYPILPSQHQPEIIGAENFNSPLLKNPQNYPGDQYAQYDNDDNLKAFNYINRDGDELRRTGDYFGVTKDSGDNVVFDPTNIDGIQIDFNTDHYVKMNTFGNETSNFDEFNTRKINGEFPSDFEFNAILWYYQVVDSKGNSATNLYGISFLDSPSDQDGDKFPSLKKVVATDDQDGVAYQFSLNKHTTISTETPQPVFDNSYVNNLFGFNLFNEAMRRLVVFNDSAMNIIAENKELLEEVNRLKQLVYTSTSVDIINSRITKLDELLRLYSTNQIVSTNSIRIEKDNTVSPPSIKMYNIEGRYFTVDNINTSNLYNESGNIPRSIEVPEGKDFLVNIINNDTVSQTLPDDQRLTIFLNRDLYYRQTVDIIINGSKDSTENKLLDIFITYNNGDDVPILRKVVDGLDLPTYFNLKTQEQNTAHKWSQINQSISKLELDHGNVIKVEVSSTRGLNEGDVILFENVFIGESDSELDINGQYIIDKVDNTDNIIVIDYTQNNNLTSYIDQETMDGNLVVEGEIEYNTMGSFRFNKGYRISITRTDDSSISSFSDRYLTVISPLN